MHNTDIVIYATNCYQKFLYDTDIVSFIVIKICVHITDIVMYAFNCN